MATKLCKLFSSCSTLVIGRRSVTTPHFRAVLSDSYYCPHSISPTLLINSKRMASSEGSAVAVNPEISSKGTADVGEIEIEPSKINNDASGSNEVTIENSTSASKSESEPQPQPLTSEGTTENQEKRGRIPKVKAALLLSYSGQGYFGMQMQNDGTKTIENDIFKALRAAAVIDEEGFQKPKSTKFQRAARTDKNVSAARNIVSIMVPKNLEIESINEHLPDQIRVMDYRRVTKGFDAKLACGSRTYLYMIPTFAFTPLEQNVVESYRVTPDVLENLRKILKMYEGTKNFHNFTSRKKPTDPSANRFIMSFTSSEPFMKEGLEYVVLKVKGQSFMLHQIRKMIGLAVAILRGFASEENLQKAFALDKIDIPMAPGLGLMLGEAHYDQYNRKFGRDGIHEPLIWDNVAEKVEAFCQEKIYTNVTKTENEEKSMLNWLATVPFHTFDSRDPDDEAKGFGPLGKANLYVKKLRGESEDELELEGDLDEDEETPKKKLRQF